MSHIDDSGDLDDDKLLSDDPVYADISDIDGDKHEVIMAAVPATSKAEFSMSSADVKLLSSAILNITKRLDKLEENPSSKGQGGGKHGARNHKMTLPPKSPPKIARAPRASKTLLTTRTFERSSLKSPETMKNPGRRTKMKR